MTRIAYFDTPAGASGDMILGAFLDAGLPLDHLRDCIAKLDIGPVELAAPKMMKQGLSATGFEVRFEPRHHHADHAYIRGLIESSGLEEEIKDRSLRVFERIARAEGRIHGVDPDEVHFHEVGAVDSIVDIVGAAAAYHYFHIEEAHASPLPLGQGFMETAHGRLPLPAPATLKLLEGLPTYGTGVEAELVTPTGAALIADMAARFGPRPAMTIETTGCGAGRRNLPDRPNLLRLSIGRAEARTAREMLVVGQTNIDDMNPEIFPFVLNKLLQAGALDAWSAPAGMKKGRPGTTVSFLARPMDADRLADLVFKETTTSGVRLQNVERLALPRDILRVKTPVGTARVKVIERPGRREAVPEFESCREIAEATGRPIREVFRIVTEAARDLEDRSDADE